MLWRFSTSNLLFISGGDNHGNVEKAIGNIPGLGLAASNGSCFSPPMNAGELARTWLALDLGVDWESVKQVSLMSMMYILVPMSHLLILPYLPWIKQVALPIMSKFTARTNGSFIKLAHSSIGWSYYSCDPEFGSLGRSSFNETSSRWESALLLQAITRKQK